MSVQIGESVNIRSDSEYDKLKASFKALYPLLAPDVPVPPEDHPFAVIERMEASSPARARTGLKMALHDMIEMTNGFSPDDVRKIDHILGAAGVLTLTELRLGYSRAVARVLKRGSINRSTEYYMLKGIYDSGIANDEQVAKINSLLLDYERRVADKS